MYFFFGMFTIDSGYGQVIFPIDSRYVKFLSYFIQKNLKFFENFHLSLEFFSIQKKTMNSAFSYFFVFFWNFDNYGVKIVPIFLAKFYSPDLSLFYDSQGQTY